MATIARERLGVTGGVAVVALANAATTVALVAYALCAALTIIAPDVFLAVLQTWFHGITLDTLRPAGGWFRFGDFVLGFVTFGGFVWLATAATAWLYDAWRRT